jgi:hypothetical protein
MATVKRKTGNSAAQPRRVPSGVPNRLTRMQGDSEVLLSRAHEGPATQAPSWRSQSLFTLLGRSTVPAAQPRSGSQPKQAGGR